MERRKILSELFYSFKSSLNKDLLQDFFKKANNLNLDESDTTKFIKNFREQMPEYDYLESLYFIEKLNSIDRSLRTIKFTLLIGFAVLIIIIISNLAS